jgi:hypothetical protein
MSPRHVILRPDLRVWQDERLGRLWRVAYDDGDGETVVTFPDLAAMGDFIAEHLGLSLVDALEGSGHRR